MIAIADVVARERRSVLRGTVARRGRLAVADRVGADDEVLRRIVRLAGSDKKVDAMPVAAKRRRHQDRIGLFSACFGRLCKRTL
jgi:hypothetical protein